MGITALPPSSVLPDDGGSYYVCNVFEWVAATLKRGDACYFQKNKLPWKRGTFRYSWFYDGIIASVYEDDPDEYILYSLFLDTHMGDKLIIPEDYVTIKQWQNR